MNARESENYLAISRSSSASKSVEIFWAEIYWGRLFLGPNITNMLSIKHSSILMISVSENVLVESEWFSTK